MYLTIWRHGEAGSAVTDRMRELTERGVEDVNAGSEQFKQLCADRDIPLPKRIFYSEWVRTTQTASIVGRALGDAALESSPALIPGRQPVDVENDISHRYPDDHLLLISHQPLVSCLVDYYVGSRGYVPGLVPGGLATLRMDHPGPALAQLVFCIQPPAFEVIL
ncbi:hypothetical protein EY643_10475 [Halioglobus maricola]|uniref:Phosphohistidine phosphatase SixA n=1 Tax=Halioglobus maricola TaxID=2601894 RepID=A0A5P9NJJ3_9GAMM|nr:hypothetical protein [Halioglobus maricola]QFU76053.1 hypothetical protein EY643_10475 [Halioglobus maricola]